ncbi:MAG: response regulator transcription factor [Lactobacillaceae bacterium]
MNKIFIIEDDIDVVTQLEKLLKKYGFEVKGVSNFNNIMFEINEFNPNIILMDLYIPVHDGYFWTHKIREHSLCPIIFISSADTEVNAITAMNVGADNYIGKPFNIDILVAKIRALIRRTYEFGVSNILTFGSYRLDLINSKIITDDICIDLTTNEFIIMKKLFENQGKIVSKVTLMKTLWDNENFIDQNALQVSMGRLRRKLSDISLDMCIKTKRGRGYTLNNETR